MQGGRMPIKGSQRYAPHPIPSVDQDQYQVRGEATIYDDPCAAIRRARKRGKGSEVIRLSDQKLIASVPGYIPPMPREWK